jgi:hypothetical protein
MARNLVRSSSVTANSHNSVQRSFIGSPSLQGLAARIHLDLSTQVLTLPGMCTNDIRVGVRQWEYSVRFIGGPRSWSWSIDRGAEITGGSFLVLVSVAGENLWKT